MTVLSSIIAQTVRRVQIVNREKENLQTENLKLKRELSEKNKINDIIGNSSRMQDVYEMVHRVVDSNATVLLRGESGTGKTLVAKALHYNGRRKDKPFVVVNCSALPETLLESELFGHEKGAFTGANERKMGRFEQAEGGTLFLDEIGEISHSVQVKLLNVVQERSFQRLGSTKSISCDVRLVAATNRDLEKAVTEGSLSGKISITDSMSFHLYASSEEKTNGYSAASRVFSGKIHQGKQEENQQNIDFSHRSAHSVPLAGKRQGAAELHGTGRS